MSDGPVIARQLAPDQFDRLKDKCRIKTLIEQQATKDLELASREIQEYLRALGLDPSATYRLDEATRSVVKQP